MSEPAATVMIFSASAWNAVKSSSSPPAHGTRHADLDDPCSIVSRATSRLPFRLSSSRCSRAFSSSSSFFARMPSSNSLFSRTDTATEVTLSMPYDTDTDTANSATLHRTHRR